MCNHELRASPPRSGRSTSSLNRPIDVSEEADNAAAAYGSLVAALSGTLPARPDVSASGQQALRQEACATAVADDRERIARDLYDAVIHRLFAAGLQLQATCQVVDGPVQSRIETTIDLLDTTITELRKAIFSLH